MSFDIHILPVSKKDGKDASDQVGIYLASPTSKTIRTRKADVVLFYLTMSNPRNFPQNKQILLFKKLADYYYQQKESVSSSLTAMIEYANRYFLNQNIQNDNAANFFNGNMTIAVFKEEKLYVAQVGKAIGFMCQGEGFSQKHAVTESVNLLGMKQGIEPFFYINELNQQSSVILAHEISKEWDKNSFRALGNQTLHVAQQRLAPAETISANFIIIKPVPGKGFIQLIQSKKRQTAESSMVSPQTSSASQSPQSHTENGRIVTPIAAPAATITPAEDRTPTPIETPQSNEDDFFEDQEEINPAELEKEFDDGLNHQPAQKKQKVPFRMQIRRFFGAIKNIFDGIYFAYHSAITPIRNFLDQRMPENMLGDLPAAWKLGITIGVPILLSIAGLFVAMNTGSELVFQQKLAEANNQYIIAENTSDPAAKKEALAKSLAMYNEALQYGNQETASDEAAIRYSQAQHQRDTIQNTLDELNQIKRIIFQPLLEGTLDNDVNITKIINTDSELFLLDSTSGEVLHIAKLQQDNYQLDEAFSCSHTAYGASSMNPIVDIAAYSGNGQSDPTIVAIDNKGLIINCYPNGQSPIAEKVELPALGFGNTTELDLKNNNLYILDKAANALWFYSLEELRKTQDQNPDLSPTFYFSENVPNLSEVQGMTVNESNLFAFYPDQHMLRCTYQTEYDNGFKTITECDDPALFEDPRIENIQTAFIQGASFSQITSTPAPEPSVFLADFSTKQIFQFSQKLRLMQVFESDTDLPDQVATAFDVSPGYKPYRTIVFAFGNQLFYAKIQ